MNWNGLRRMPSLAPSLASVGDLVASMKLHSTTHLYIYLLFMTCQIHCIYSQSNIIDLRKSWRKFLKVPCLRNAERVPSFTHLLFLQVYKTPLALVESHHLISIELLNVPASLRVEEELDGRHQKCIAFV